MNRRRLLSVCSTGAATIGIGLMALSGCGSDPSDNTPASQVPSVSASPTNGSTTTNPGATTQPPTTVHQSTTTVIAPQQGGSVAPGQQPQESAVTTGS